MRDFVLYILIGSAVIASVFAALAFDVPKDTFLRWIGIVMFPAVLFGWYIEKSKEFWRSRLFWTITGVLVALHCGLFGVLIATAHQPKKSTDWIYLTFAEWAVFFAARSQVRAMVRRSSSGQNHDLND